MRSLHTGRRPNQRLLGVLLALLAPCLPPSAGRLIAYDFDEFSCEAPCVDEVGGHAVALRSFDLRLTSDDRHVQGLHAAPNDRIDGPRTQFLLMMWDEHSGPGDFHAVEMAPAASLFDLTSVGRYGHVTTERCAGECRLALDLEDDETFLLAGFDLRYLDDGELDHHVRRISINPGEDASGHHVTVALQDDDGHRPFSASVHFVAVPDDLVAVRTYADSGQVGVSGVFSEPRPPGPAVLTGFSVSWSEDHHFKRLMIDLGNDRVRAAFHDNDVDRTFEHFVWFVVLREPAG